VGVKKNKKIFAIRINFTFLLPQLQFLKHVLPQELKHVLPQELKHVLPQELKHVLVTKIEVPDSKKYNYNKKGHNECGLFYYDVANANSSKYLFLPQPLITCFSE
jgi:hypothetical protein